MSAIMPLAMAPEGAEVEVVSIQGGRGLVRRLMELGLTRGAMLRVLRSGPGPVLVEVRGSRLALGWGVAMRVIVSLRRK